MWGDVEGGDVEGGDVEGDVEGGWCGGCDVGKFECEERGDLQKKKSANNNEWKKYIPCPASKKVNSTELQGSKNT